jgi:hypothetical protein
MATLATVFHSRVLGTETAASHRKPFPTCHPAFDADLALKEPALQKAPPSRAFDGR